MATKTDSKMCAYCTTNPGDGGEHAFPKGLGGETIFMDCVCKECNKLFSDLEAELLNRSPVALMRSSAGVEGYKNKKRGRKAPLRYDEIFELDEENKIVYECGTHLGFKAYRRPQLILIEGKIYVEGASKEEVQLFIDKLVDWWESVRTIAEVPKIGTQYNGHEFSLNSSGKVTSAPVLIAKITSHMVSKKLTHGQANEAIYEPRVFLDEEERLILRSRSFPESNALMARVVEECIIGKTELTSFSDKSNKKVHSRMKFNIEKMQRATVKIGLNALIHYYPSTQYNPLLEKAKQFVLGTTKETNWRIAKRTVLDTDSPIHYVAFAQYEQGLVVQLSLFSGHFKCAFQLDGLRLHYRDKEVTFLEVNHDLKKQALITDEQFVSNRNSEMGPEME